MERLATALNVSLDFLAGRSVSPEQAAGPIIDSIAQELNARYGIDIEHSAQARLSPIPVIGKVSAGPGFAFTDQGYPVGEGEYTISRHGDDDPHAYGVIAEGDSMSERIEAGEVVVASPSKQWHSGCISILRKRNGDVMVKKVFDKGDHYLLVSVNSAYEPETVSKADVLFVHKVTSIRPK